MMIEDAFQEYDADLTLLLESVWGEGFLSPGGTAEVDRFLDKVSLTEKRVLDIGSGLGGIDIYLASRHELAHIHGIDIDPYLIDRSTQLADRQALSERVSFQQVDPGPLPFPDASFDLVISKDSIIHIPDKQELASDIYRVLRPGGEFAASDWLAGYEGEPPPEMIAYLEAEGLDFGLANAAVYREALADAGFENQGFTDRNEWYRAIARDERTAMRGHLFNDLSQSLEKSFLERELTVWDTMIDVLDKGYLRPTHLYARKPL